MNDMIDCACNLSRHQPKLVVLTGGPGAGKTAVLEVLARSLCRHVAVLPEAASIVFGGGFPRAASEPTRRAAQRAIYRVQEQLERAFLEEQASAVVLCDRGLLDGFAYWPGDPSSLFADVGADREALLARYAAVIHLRTPAAMAGYNHRNPLRTESADEALALDDRILAAWEGHPRRFVIESEAEFLAKAKRAVELVRAELPPCCRTHPIAYEAHN